MALTDLTRISTAGIATGTSLSGAVLHGDAHFRGTQVGVTSALFDSSDNALEFNDNVKLKFGNSGDLQLYHDNVVSRIRDQGTGILLIESDEIKLGAVSNGNPMLVARQGLGVSMMYNGNTKFETTNHGAVVAGILTATGFSGPLSNTSGISTFYDLRVSNNLTVEGTTTTLDTNLIGVDRVEVGANSNTVTGIAVTQSGTADIVRLYDGASQVVTIDDTGNVGIGSAIPTQKLDVAGKGRFSDDLIILNGKILTLLNDANTANVKIDCDGGARLNVKSYDKSVIQAQENWGVRFFQGNEVERFAIEPTGGVVVGAGGTIKIPDKMMHVGDEDTYLQFTDNTINLHAGGTTGLSVQSASVRVPTKLGINGAAPQTPLDVIANGSGYAMAIRGRSSDNTAELRFTSNDYGTLYGQIVTGPTYLNLKTGGVERLQLDASEATFNSTGADTDFRIRTPAQGHMFFVDAGNDQVSIKTSSAQSGAVLTVNGRTHLEQLTLGNNSTLDAGAQATIYKPATNMLAFATAGANERLRIDNNGKFLFGVTSARSGFFNTASQFNPHFQIEGAGDADDPGRVTSIIYNSTTTASPTLLFGKTNTGSVGGTGAVANNHGLGLITFQGMVGGQFTQGATISATVSGTPGDNDLPTHLSFGTCADGAASASERMRITADGKFSLGTINATPAAAVHIDYDTNNMLMLDNSTSSTQKIFFAQNASTHAIIYATSAQGSLIFDSDPDNNHSNSTLAFKVDGAQRLKINDTGDIGINFDGTPNGTLDIRTDRDPSTGLMCFIRNNAQYGNGAYYGMDINSVGTWSIGMPDNTNALSFRNGGQGNSGTEYLRVNHDGQLTISGTRSGNSIPDVSLKFNILDSNGNDKKATIAATKVGDINSELIFSTTVSHAFAERLKIDSSGNLVQSGNVFSQSSASNTVISTTRTTEGVVTSLQSISNPVGRVGTTSNHSLEVVAYNNPAFTVDSSGGILAHTKSFVSKFHYNPGIQSTGGWSTNWNTIIPGGTLSYNDTYVITAYWQHNHNGGNAGSPYLLQASFLYSSVSTNNTTAGNVEFVPFQTAHVGGGTHRLEFRFLPVAGHTTAAVQVKNPAGFHGSYGGIIVKAHVLSDY